MLSPLTGLVERNFDSPVCHMSVLGPFLLNIMSNDSEEKAYS